jgi:uncharacterized membrane protein YphA (DoxX/SURF4 family)
MRWIWGYRFRRGTLFLALCLSVLSGVGLVAGLAGWFASPAYLLLNYMLDIAHLMAHIPHVFIQNRSLPLAAMLGLYGLVILVTYVLWHKTRPSKSDIITDMNEPEARGWSV